MGKGSKLSPHATFTHRDGYDMVVFQEWQPPTVKIFENVFRSYTLIDQLFQLLPNALICFRDWPLSEQKEDMFRDPVGTAHRHAQGWRDLLDHYQHGTNEDGVKLVPHFDRSRAIVLGINEPPVWDWPLESIRYNQAFAEACTEHAIRAGLLNLSVGWPHNKGPDTPADWAPFEPVLDAMLAARKRGIEHVLFLHEYWYKEGPQHNWKWWAGRYQWCPWNVPIVIGECGIDSVVAADFPHKGWRHFVNTETYIEQLRWYDDQIRQDPRILGAQIYTYDYGHNRWHTFDIRDDRGSILSYTTSRKDEAYEAWSPQPARPEPAPDDLTGLLKEQLGNRFHDVRQGLDRHPSRTFDHVDSRQMRYIALHHSTGPRSVSVEAIARHHVRTNGWAGIGYHFVVRQGHVYYVGDVDTQRAHVGGSDNHVPNRNRTALGICITGTYTEQEMDGEDVEALRKLVAALDAYYGHEKEITTHRDMLPPNYTVCPGRVAEQIPHLRPAGNPATDLGRLANDARWNAEQAVREIQVDNDRTAHQRLLDEVIPRLYELERQLKGR